MWVALAVALTLGQTPATSPAEQAVRALYQSFNAHDSDALVAQVSDDIKWATVGADALKTEAAGKDALRASMQRYFKSLPTVRSRIEAIMAAGEFVTVHERVTWGKAPAEKTQSAVAVYKVRDGRITNAWYFDVMK